MELSTVLRCIKQLLSPPKEGTSILLSLEETLDTFQRFVSEQELTNELKSATAGLKTPEYGDDVAAYCRFTENGLALLSLLNEALTKAHREDLCSTQIPNEKQQSSSEQKQQPPPKALLSSSEEKSVQTLLQFVVALGIFPFLLPGADHLLEAQLGEMAPLITRSSTDPLTRSVFLYHHCRPLLQLFHTPVIGPSVVSRHLSTVLVTLLQVSHFSQTTPSPHPREGISGGDISPIENSGKYQTLSSVAVEGELTDLLDKLHQPVVVRELLRLQGTQRGAGGRGGGPRWLQKACGRLLSERLMKEDGVHAVLMGIFETTAGGEGVGSGCQGDWKRVQAVAQIISRCPSQASSLSHYYSTIGPQLLKLLTLPGRATVQVSAATISLMMKIQPALTRSHLLQPLTAPLRATATGDFTESEPVSADLSKAVEITIGSLHRLCGCVEPSSPLMPELQPLLPVLFKIWQATSTADKISKNFRSDVVSVMVTVLNSLESVDKVQLFRHLADMPPSRAGGVEWVPVSPEVSLKFETEGRGLCVERVRGGEGEIWSVERMEEDGRAMVELLGTVLRPSQLTGQFFLECLTCVAAILCQDLGYQSQAPNIRTEIKAMSSMKKSQKSSKSSASSVLLDIEEKSQELTQAESYRRSLILYLTAALSEEKTSDILEQTDTRQLLQLLAVVVDCHAHIVMRKENEMSSSLNLLVVQPDLDQMLGGPITLSIALGYFSAILTGANQLEKEQRGLLSGVVGSLEVISRGYPDPELASLAEDLRVCIATLGAVWSREMKEWAGGKKGERGKVVTELKRESEKRETQLPKSWKIDKDSDRDLVESEKPVKKLIEEIPEITDQPPPQPNQQEGSREENSSRFQQALVEAEDHEIPVRGHGLSSLARLVTTGDRETLTHSPHLLGVFKDALNHTDSYIYLPAIGGLVALASREPLKVLNILCEGYALFSKSQPPQNRNKVDKETGELSKKRETVSEGSGRKEVSVELRLKLGEALVRVTRECGELLPHYSNSLLAAVLSNVRDPHPLVRGSALSDLADICQLLGHSFNRYHHEVLGCVTQLLHSDPTPQVQQSALLVLTLLLKGLSHRSVEVLGDSLRDVYHLLKKVEREGGREEVTRDHARAALAQLDQIMRDWAFPQPTLSKNITIL